MNENKLEKSLNQKMTLVGTARDAKGGAVLVITDGSPIYIEGLTSWPPELEYKQVSVSGWLRKKKLIPDPRIDANGGISQGAMGSQLVLEKAVWEKVSYSG